MAYSPKQAAQAPAELETQRTGLQSAAGYENRERQGTGMLTQQKSAFIMLPGSSICTATTQHLQFPICCSQHVLAAHAHAVSPCLCGSLVKRQKRPVVGSRAHIVVPKPASETVDQ
eukprot:366119-Chlamydomonas_euryale.AAC.16